MTQREEPKKLKITFSPHISARIVPRDPPRPLSRRERALLDFLLDRPLSNHDDLFRQAAAAQVGGECSCGCGTIVFVVPDRPEGLARGPGGIISEAVNRNDPAIPVDIMLWTRNGVLRETEVVWFTDTRPMHYLEPAGLSHYDPKSVPPSPPAHG